MPIDGYKIWAFVNVPTNEGYNFQGTMTTGLTTVKYQTECGINGVKTWYSLNGPTVLAVANGTGGYLTSTNSDQVLTDWPTFGFNPQNTRYNSTENILNTGNVSSLVLKWSYNTSADSYTAVANGIAYTSGGNFVYALNVSTGAYVWSYPITSSSSPAVANGVVYVSSTDGHLYALNATSGAYLWSYNTGSTIYSSPTVSNGVVYVGSDDRNLYALNASNGAYLWSYGTSGAIDASPIVSNGVVYVGSQDSYLYTFHLPGSRSRSHS